MSKKADVNHSTPQVHAHTRALYREYRPQDFKSVIGQDHVVKVLEASIANNTISHAYVFSGSRGTGKTSIARIFAKALDTADEDIFEIDAASNTSVDNIRELTESVNTLPFRSKYKVYILDEVHMLSKAAFNAFLKTLEEPPAHVIFILATTETDRVPETVLSRCQVFSFNKPSVEILVEVVKRTAKAEKLTLEEGVAELIALLGDGSFRDTHGALQKAMSVSKDDIVTLKDVEVLLGAPSSTLVHEFLEGYAEKNIEKSLKAISAVKEAHVSFILFSKLLIRLARAAVLLKFLKKSEAIQEEFGEHELKWLTTFIEKAGDSLTSEMLSDLLKAEEETRNAFIPELPLEAAVLKRV